MLALPRAFLRAIQQFLKLALIQPSARLLLQLYSWLHRRIARYFSLTSCTTKQSKKQRSKKDHDLDLYDSYDITRHSEGHELKTCPTRSSSQCPPPCFVAESRVPDSLSVAEEHPLRIIPPPPDTEATLVQSPDINGVACQPITAEDSYDVGHGVYNHVNIVESPQEDKKMTGDTALTSPSTSSLSSQEQRRPLLADTQEGFRPLVPDNVSRYERTDTAAEDYMNITIKACTNTYLDQLQIPGWTIYTHPEGTCIFYNEELRIFTEVDLFNEVILRETMVYATALYDYLETINESLGSDVHIVFELMPRPKEETEEDKLKYICNYYLVKHSAKTVFWLDDVDAREFPLSEEVMGAQSRRHIHHLVEASYWYHCALYPTSRPWSVAGVDDMRDILVHAIIDSMTSATSTAPYSVSDLQQMLSVMNSMRKSVGPSIGAMSAMCRLMNFFVQQRYYNFHGQPCARLDRDKSVHGTPIIRHSPLLLIVSPFLFSAPDVHLRSLQKIWVDRILHLTAYTALITKLTGEWQELILTATVLLNANVAFLAIQSVDEEVDLPQRSAAQLASYVSILASMGSIILGLLLVRQNRTKSKESAVEAAAYIAQRHHPRLGLETLAILWSLPYALLMWATLSFTLAFACMIFQDTSNYIRTGLGSVFCLIAVLIVWCIITSWEVRPDERNFVRNLWDKASTFKASLLPSPTSDAQSDSENTKIEEEVTSGRKQRSRLWSSLIGSVRRSSEETAVDAENV